ncbi:2,3-dehydroadipyl-CoA hydratase [Rubripirellula tenax]|uniref:2,3-dehydroadipyl-CoA hydratase n=1 Tax=Rubripirellula tenax TaxID=2528015 RepID=A0A5C6F913_9BACT|nr:enoyl-CoA hydratase/isomerase family protein [Rubripirellula tenax]TWU56636.1 2,3-dehydroadipyl-CoA hydratase [Rubripirellula tenax]
MQYVDVKIHENVATLLMDRAGMRNSLNPQLIDDLKTAFSDVHQEKRVRAVVLAGSGEHFCAGIDLRVFGEIAALPTEEALGQWHAAWWHLTELFEQMLRFPKPIVAAVDGSAIGAGLGLALACDIIVPSTRAHLGAGAVRVGLVGGATAALLTFRAGGATASRMLLTSESVDADEAYRLNLTIAPVSSEHIWIAAKDAAQKCSHGPYEAVQATKRLLNESIGETLMTQLTAGAADSATACTTESAAEGIRSFLDKRVPKWP